MQLQKKIFVFDFQNFYRRCETACQFYHSVIIISIFFYWLNLRNSFILLKKCLLRDTLCWLLILVDNFLFFFFVMCEFLEMRFVRTHFLRLQAPKTDKTDTRGKQRRAMRGREFLQSTLGSTGNCSTTERHILLLKTPSPHSQQLSKPKYVTF